MAAMQCAGNEDIITMKAEDAGDTVSFMFESPSQDRIAGERSSAHPKAGQINQRH